MALRFRRRVTLFPGVRLNIGKTGVSVSGGIRGASVTVGKHGVHGNVGAPGTGLSYRTRLDNKAGKASPTGASHASGFQQSFTVTLGDRGELLIHDAGGIAASPAVKRTLWQHHSDEITAFLTAECARINNDADALQYIHTDTPPLSSAPPKHIYQPFELTEPIRPTLPSLPIEPVPPKKYFWHRLLPVISAKQDQNHHLKHQAWQQNFNQTKQVRRQLQHTFEQALAHWQRQEKSHRQQQHAASETFAYKLNHDTEFMADLLESKLATLNWPRDTHVSFEIQTGVNGFEVLLDVDLPTSEEFPNRSARFSKNGRRLLIKTKSATQQRMEYARHVHGVVLKLAGVTWVTLPSVQHLTVLAYTQRLNSATGHIDDEYLLSVRIQREQWQQLNLTAPEKIDPIAALTIFELTRNMTKTGIFTKISV